MNTKWIVLVTGFVCACVGAELEFPTVARDGFEVAEFSSGPALGFCVEVGEPTSVKVSRGTDGWVAEGARVVPADADADGNCITANDFGECTATESFGPSPVADSDYEELRSLLERLPARSCHEDTHIACDYCRVDTITVDGEAVAGECCGDLNEEFRADFQRLSEVFSRIAASAG